MSDSNTPPANVVSLEDYLRRRLTDDEIIALKDCADELDAVILRHLRLGRISARDVAGLLSHRLGTLMMPMAEKEDLWLVCKQVFERQAGIKA